MGSVLGGPLEMTPASPGQAPLLTASQVALLVMSTVNPFARSAVAEHCIEEVAASVVLGQVTVQLVGNEATQTPEEQTSLAVQLFPQVPQWSLSLLVSNSGEPNEDNQARP